MKAIRIPASEVRVGDRIKLAKRYAEVITIIPYDYNNEKTVDIETLSVNNRYYTRMWRADQLVWVQR